MEAVVLGFQTLFSTPSVFILMVFGVFMGIVFGCIPGLTATLGVTLMIPFTFTMSPEQGLALLVGIFVGGISGGLITAILINIPGTPSSIATCWDGYPMAKEGRAWEALAFGVFASLFGGTLSAMALFTISPMIAKVALQMQSWEMFSVCLMGLTVVTVMTGKGEVLKGLLGMFLGLLLGTIGMDLMLGTPRWTFGHWQLMAGIQATALMMSLFAIRDVMDQVLYLHVPKPVMDLKKTSFIPPFKKIKKESWRAMGVGGITGTFIGILPGVGQNVAAILSYNQAKSLSKHPEKFGTGATEGLVASESANNACNGGALIPLITLGIPGDLVTAALIGGPMIHGLQPGPRLFVDHPRIVGTIMAVYFMANVIMYIMELGLLKVFVKMIQVRLSYLFPAVTIFCILGVYAQNNLIFDVWVLIIFAVVAYILNQFGINLVSIILGFILGPLIERYFKQGLLLTEGQLIRIFDRPIAATFLAIAVLFLFVPTITEQIKKRKMKASQ